jgi:hypothetical protein
MGFYIQFMWTVNQQIILSLAAPKIDWKRLSQDEISGEFSTPTEAQLNEMNSVLFDFYSLFVMNIFSVKAKLLFIFNP